MSGLVTVTLRVPVVVVEEIVTVAVSWLALLNVHEFTVIPAPKLQVAPLWKLLPVRATFSFCFRVPEVGFSELKVGGGAVGCRICTQSTSAVGFVLAALLPTWIPKRGLVIVSVRLPIETQVLPPSVE